MSRFEFDPRIGRQEPDDDSMREMHEFLDATVPDHGDMVMSPALYRLVLGATWLHGWKIRHSRKEVENG